MARFLGRAFVGCFVSIPLVCVLAGGVEQGFMLLFLSIVCTAGIGLVVWIPVWWVVGSLTLAIVSQFMSNTENKPRARGIAAPFLGQLGLQSDMALMAYIRKATATGMDAEEMTRRLQLNGWPMGEIEIAHQRFNSSQ